MARAPVLAAGGIVLRRGAEPLVAVVRQRKRGEWVLPKGKLDDGETAKEAAWREVLEETGHDVAVHEFLGTLAYQSGGRAKTVHFWRMEADGMPVRELMRDITAVDWLPLQAAVDRLSREYERAFLAEIGPIAVRALAVAAIEVPPPLAVETAVRTSARTGSFEDLRQGVLRRLKAWLRGGARLSG